MREIDRQNRVHSSFRSMTSQFNDEIRPTLIIEKLFFCFDFFPVLEYSNKIQWCNFNINKIIEK